MNRCSSAGLSHRTYVSHSRASSTSACNASVDLGSNCGRLRTAKSTVRGPPPLKRCKCNCEKSAARRKTASTGTIPAGSPSRCQYVRPSSCTSAGSASAISVSAGRNARKLVLRPRRGSARRSRGSDMAGICTDCRSCDERCVPRSNRRMDSIWSPKNSMRTGSVCAFEKTSTMPPRWAKSPGTSTASQRLKPCSLSQRASSAGSSVSPTSSASEVAAMASGDGTVCIRAMIGATMAGGPE